MYRVIERANHWLGYLEKKDAKELYSKTSNAGYNNFTCFWDMLAPSLQGQPWCNVFINAIFTECYGKEMAKKLLCTDGDWSYYTPTSSSYFKKKGQWHSTPKVGDIIYFRNSERIHHVGLVIKVGDTITTIEGNTSASPQDGVVANGGGVYQKEYAVWNTSIAGYGRPNYALIDADKYTAGWHKDTLPKEETGKGYSGWWYADTTKTYVHGKWKVINGCKYYFNENGYAVTGLHVIGGRRYFFEDTPGASKECALMITESDGALKVWNESTGNMEQNNS